MRIRKCLVAAVTATAVSVSGVSVPAMADQKDAEIIRDAFSSGRAANITDEDSSSKAAGKQARAMSSDSQGNLDPGAIMAWIALFTAILGVLGGAAGSLQNFLKP